MQSGETDEKNIFEQTNLGGIPMKNRIKLSSNCIYRNIFLSDICEF